MDEIFANSEFTGLLGSKAIFNLISYSPGRLSFTDDTKSGLLTPFMMAKKNFTRLCDFKNPN
jgi:hypothetical protein